MSEPHWRTRTWFPEIDERTHERLRIYQIELIRWTRKINLISPSTIEDSDRLHFADSILGGREIVKDLSQYPSEMQLWDLGSGNGFPGIILALLAPERAVICVDSDERKVAFLRQLITRLEITNVGARLARVEALPKEGIGLAVSRAFAPLDKALLYGRAAIAAGGIYYNMKGDNYKQELIAARRAAQIWETDVLGTYSLPALPDSDVEPPKRVILKSKRV